MHVKHRKRLEKQVGLQIVCVYLLLRSGSFQKGKKKNNPEGFFPPLTSFSWISPRRLWSMGELTACLV